MKRSNTGGWFHCLGRKASEFDKSKNISKGFTRTLTFKFILLLNSYLMFLQDSK